MLGLLGSDGINVLVNGIGGALIPLVADALHRREHFDELTHLAAKNVPAFADVAVQRERLVLCEDIYAAQVRIEAVGECDIDDSVDAAEGDRRLGAVPSERIEALSSAACQKNPQRVFHG